MEQIVRIVLLFDVYQAIIVGAVGSGHAPTLFFGHEVHVGTGGGIRCGSLKECACPRNAALILFPLIPAGVHVKHKLCSSLVRSPISLLRAGKDALKVVTFRSGDLKLKRFPNSVDTLAPSNRFVKAINSIPITPGIPYHTIIGDRGRGDSPKSSDGIVPYWRCDEKVTIFAFEERSSPRSLPPASS